MPMRAHLIWPRMVRRVYRNSTGHAQLSQRCMAALLLANHGVTGCRNNPAMGWKIYCVAATGLHTGKILPAYFLLPQTNRTACFCAVLDRQGAGSQPWETHHCAGL